MSLHSLDAVIWAIFLGILVTVAEAVRQRDGAAVVNAIVVVAVALAPVVLEATTASITTGVELTIWLGLAGLLHMVGMLGVYESVWWWDHVTHTVSAALVAALCYGGLLVASDASRPVGALLAVGLTVAAGIFWELIELLARALGQRYDVEPVLVYYGWSDTAFDLVFDIVGAAVVVVLDIDVFVALAAQAPDTAGTILGWGTAVVVGGSLAIAAVLTVADEWPQPEVE